MSDYSKKSEGKITRVVHTVHVYGSAGSLKKALSYINDNVMLSPASGEQANGKLELIFVEEIQE